jgi:hypothetical protein
MVRRNFKNQKSKTGIGNPALVGILLGATVLDNSNFGKNFYAGKNTFYLSQRITT